MNDPLGTIIYYNDGNGGHASLYIHDPLGGGYWEFNFRPANGGYDYITLNVFYGDSILTLKKIPNNQKPDGVCVDTSDEDDFYALVEAFALKEVNLSYSVIFNNCAHMCRAVLNAAGLNLGNPTFDTPTKLMNDFQRVKK